MVSSVNDNRNALTATLSRYAAPGTKKRNGLPSTPTTSSYNNALAAYDEKYFKTFAVI